ncbi:uncharacterized protein EV420DRAFT_472015 [Desarmillaria tabescens]|uniref:DUF6534 domain-containing protein n=1 Tax=Armillaria tabescens TaxID=1929756 RepID=A0AA39KD98_ARMTA|nr:uncharacterized protein EV420DRAFT_472015 [Desarmillaria tabescens]KAK0457674.1 hypothetical protein EV420DRAFT_472015 [Desarmillaria tabescens]
MSVASASQGPMLVGHMLNILLMGVVLVQVYIYMMTYQKRDKLWLKAFVFFLLIVNLLNTVTQFIYIYTALIVHFMDPAYLAKVTAVFAISGALTGVISGSVQLFFAWRVKILTSNIWLVAMVCATALAGTTGSIGSTIEAMKIGTFLRFQDIKAWVILWLVATCAADILITVILVWHLYSHKTGFRGSDELVDKIIRSTVQTGLITTCCALIDLLTYLLDPTGLHLVFNFPLPKLYTNTLLSSLNSRGGWSYDSSAESHSHTTGGIVSGGAPRSKQGVRLDTATHPEVFVTVEHHEMEDVSLRKPDLHSVDRDIKVDPSFDGSHSWEQIGRKV